MTPTPTPIHHDTATVHPEARNPDITLVPASAHDYVRKIRQIKTDTAPVAATLASAAAWFGTALLIAAPLWGTAPHLLGLPSTGPLIAWISVLACTPFLALTGVLYVINAVRESQGHRFLQVLDEQTGVEHITAPNFFIYADLGTTARVDILARVTEEITPDVRDRLLALVTDGQKDAATEAVAILFQEARNEWRRERDQAASGVLKVQESVTRRALGRKP